MQHGAGRKVLRIPSFYDGGDLAEMIKGLPDRLQYALLYSIWKAASYARREAQTQTRREWAQAYVDGRIKKHRATKHQGARVEVLPA